MLHFRMIVPAELAAAVDAALEEHRAVVSNVIRMPGAGVDPRGDVILCDVDRTAASELLGELHRAGLDRTGSISVESVDLTLPRYARRSATAVFGGEDDAVVWQEVEARAGDGLARRRLNAEAPAPSRGPALHVGDALRSGDRSGRWSARRGEPT
ncbi:hypothetical protein ACWKWP_16595, partial [Agromyces soli]